MVKYKKREKRGRMEKRKKMKNFQEYKIYSKSFVILFCKTFK